MVRAVSVMGTARVNRVGHQARLDETKSERARSWCMFEIRFHRLPLAVALAVSLTVGYAAALGVRGLASGTDINRPDKSQAAEFPVELRGSEGLTVWTE